MINKLHPNSEQILKLRYYATEDEDWPALCRRVVDNVVPLSCAKYSYKEEDIEDKKQKTFDLINQLYFLPNSPTLFNAGTSYPMLSACFIIDVVDDLPSIYESVKESAVIHKMGGGVGLSFSKLRTRGSCIGTTHGSSSGAVSFIRVFSRATEEITAGGRRKGANMGILNIDHGDILEFLSCKETEGDLANFNITVGVTDKFMDAFNNDEDFDLIDPKDGSVRATVKARDLLLKIARGAWLNGEPGVFFIDTVNRDNPTPHLGKIMSSNPCQPGWASVISPLGKVFISNVDVGDTIWSGKRWTKIVRKVHSGIKPVYQYITMLGSFIGTEEHRVLQNGVKIMVKDANSIDTANIPPFDINLDQHELEELSKSNIIIDRVYCGEYDVYDLTVDDPDHTYVTDGLLVSNCGEFYNIPYNSCNLGSLNLTKYVGPNKNVLWDLLKEHIYIAVEYLDCIIDANKYPLDKIDVTTKATRPVGLGVFGFADMLIMMGIRYDSEEALSMASELSEFISYHSLYASVSLSEKRGPYPEFRAENHRYERQAKHGRLDWASLIKDIETKGLRNSHTVVIAPTGTLARIANQCSFGIEPVYAISFESNILDRKQVTIHPLYKAYKSGELDIDENAFVVAKDIPWKSHIDMQAAWQVFVHNGISKTINMPSSATDQDVLQAYTYAYSKGLKGITVYVEGSRDKEVLVSTERAKKTAGRKQKDIDIDILKKLVTDKKMTANELSDIFDCSISTIRRRVKEIGMSAEILPDRITRPDELWGPKYRIPTPSGNVFLEIGVDQETGRPLETIVSVSKSGSSENALAEALGKMISRALQFRIDPNEVVDTLKDIIGGDSVSWWRNRAIKSIPDAIAVGFEVYLSDYYKKNKVPNKAPDGSAYMNGGTCPSCGEYTTKSEGCQFCPSCGWGKCS